MDEQRYPHLNDYLTRHMLEVRLSVYYSGIFDFVGDIYERSKKMDVKGTLVCSERAKTVDELFVGLDHTAKLLLEAEAAS